MGSTYLWLILDHLRYRPIRVSLTVVGVAVGVSAWLAIRLANGEVLRVFHESVDAAVGEASLVITGQRGAFDERVIRRVRQHPGVRETIPVVSVTTTIVNGAHRGRTIMVVGLDLLAGMSRGRFAEHQTPRAHFGLDALLARDAVFVDTECARNWHIAQGDRLTLQIDDHRTTVTVHGIMEGSWPGPTVFTDALVMDIATAQALFGRVGQLDRVYIVKHRGYAASQLLAELATVLPSSVVVSRVQQRGAQVETMIRTFHLNLEVLSTVGLLIGMFLVYNTVSFSVVQHRREIGILRALGFSRLQIHSLFLGEAVMVGAVGGLLGAGLGSLITEGITELVSQSVTDLYAPISPQSTSGFSLPWKEGLVVGMGLAVCGALRPCWEAGNTVVIKALAPADYEALPLRGVASAMWTSMGAGLLSIACLIPGPVYGLPLFGYLSAFFLLVACIVLGPVGIALLTLIVNRFLVGRISVNGVLAADHVARAPSRSSVTIAALVIGVAVIVGVGTMVRSFRAAVEEWIDQTFMADIIVGSMLPNKDRPLEPLEEGLPMHLLKALRTIQGVEAVDPYRLISTQANGQPVSLVARDLALHAERSRYLFRAGDSSTRLRQAIAWPGALISEVLAHRLNVAEGDRLQLDTDVGIQQLPIVGVFADYATDGGKVVIDRALYRRWWHDDRTTVFAVYLADGVHSQEVRQRIEAKLHARFPVSTIGHRELRVKILAIFDRTFRVTSILEFIALCVAVLGILNTLTTAIVERQRELATLRALGASLRQIHRLVFWEAGFLAGIGAALGIMGGIGLAIVLIKVINKQAFGWTIPLTVSPETLFEAIAVSGIAAIVAAYFPARWAAKQGIAEGLRYE